MNVAILLANPTPATAPISLLVAILGTTFVLADMMLVEIEPSS